MQNADLDKRQQDISYTKKIWIAAAIITLFIIVLLLFKALFSLVLLIFAGVLVAIYFYGCAGILQRKVHLSPTLSIILSVLINIILLVGFFWFVGARLQEEVSQLSDTLPQTLQDAKDKIGESNLGRKFLNYIDSGGNSEKTKAVVKQFFSSGFGALSDLYIVILLAAFFTASPASYRKGIIHLLPKKAKETGKQLLNELGDTLKKWLKGMIFGFFFIAVLTAIALVIIGMPLVLVLSLLAGLLNFIPNFGPIIALIPAVLLALMQGPTTALIILCTYTGIQIIQSAVTQPLIQKKMINLPPALIIAGQVAMGSLSGFWGVLLATPIVAVLMRVVDKLYISRQHQ